MDEQTSDTEVAIPSQEDLVPLMTREDLVPQKFREAYADLADHLKFSSEDILHKKFQYTMVDERLRLSFWREMERCIKSGRQMAMTRIANGVCTLDTLYKKIEQPDKLAWIIQPVVQYETRTSALLNVAVRRYDEIVNMPITEYKKVTVGVADDGQPIKEYRQEVNLNKARLVLDVVKHLEERVKGLAVAKSVVVNENAPQNAKVEAFDMDKIEAKLSELRGKIDNNAPDVIDAECVEVKNEG